MSLVNYGSSDDSSSEEDNSKTQTISRQKQDSQAPTELAATPPPRSIRPANDASTARPRSRPMSKEADVSLGEPMRKRSLLSSLPPPKSSKIMKGFPMGDDGSKVLSEVDSSTNIKRSFLNLPAPKKKSQTVKITLPSLPDPGSDDDDDEPIAKKPLVPSKGVSGLLSMLPKPRSAMSSRILVPHTVSRKPQPSVPKPKPQVKPAPKKTSTTVTSAEYGSDDDMEEGSSFFSLGLPAVPVSGVSPTVPISEVSSSSKDNLKNKASLPSLPIRTVNEDYLKADSSSVRLGINSKPSVSSASNVSLPESSNSPSSSSTTSRLEENSPSAVSSSISMPPSDVLIASTSRTEHISSTHNPATDSNPPSHNRNIADAPLSFNTSHSSSTIGYGQVTSSYYGSYDYSNYDYQEGQSAYEYNQPYQDSINYQNYPDTTAVDNTQEGNFQETNKDDDDEFRKFLGKKRGKEDINMISINADDQTAGSSTREALLKGISEEKQPMSYSKKKNSDLPSSQQRRKHQITYLAFQAKERELALKNQWSQNRMTRKQTQAKYGF